MFLRKAIIFTTFFTLAMAAENQLISMSEGATPTIQRDNPEVHTNGQKENLQNLPQDCFDEILNFLIGSQEQHNFRTIFNFDKTSKTLRAVAKNHKTTNYQSGLPIIINSKNFNNAKQWLKDHKWVNTITLDICDRVLFTTENLTWLLDNTGISTIWLQAQKQPSGARLLSFLETTETIEKDGKKNAQFWLNANGKKSLTEEEKDILGIVTH